MKKKNLLILAMISLLLLSACALTDRLFDQGKQVIQSILNQDELAEFEEPQPVEAVETAPAMQAIEEPADTAQTEEPLIEPQIAFDSNCYHPYFPITEDAYWTYQESTGEGYTLRVADIGQDSFTLVQEMTTDNTLFSAEWYCSESGILSGSFSQFDFLNMSGEEEDMPEFVVDSFEWDGETLPAPKLLIPGYQWTTTYQMRGEFNLEDFPQTLLASISIEYEVGAIEEVTVPAGTFPEAVRVDSDGIVEMVLELGETAMPFTTSDFNSSTWYVEGVGMVKTSDQFTGFSNMVELIASSATP